MSNWSVGFIFKCSIKRDMSVTGTYSVIYQCPDIIQISSISNYTNLSPIELSILLSELRLPAHNLFFFSTRGETKTIKYKKYTESSVAVIFFLKKNPHFCETQLVHKWHRTSTMALKKEKSDSRTICRGTTKMNFVGQNDSNKKVIEQIGTICGHMMHCSRYAPCGAYSYIF